VPRRILIEFDARPGENSSSLTHRVRNLGEDLFREFSDTGWATMSLAEVDAATDKLQLTVHRKSDLGSAMRVVKTLLKKHHFDGYSKVSDDG